MKKAISLILALMLCVSLTIPALAAEQTVIYVSNAEELREAIGSDRKIVLSAGVYDLRTFDERGYLVGGAYLDIQDVDNLTIVGEGYVELMNERYNELVVRISNSTNVTLENMKIGHGELTQSCIEGVLHFFSSSATIRNCDIYGCGTSGFSASMSSVTMEGTVIHDCSETIVSLSDAVADFRNCVFRNNGYDVNMSKFWPAMYGYNFALWLENCEFTDNKNTGFIGWGTVNMIDCAFSGNGWPEEQQTLELPTNVAGFTDVPTGEKYANSVTWAKENGVTYGKTDTIFGTMDTVTRAQAVTFLYRAMGEPQTASAYNPFTDIDPAAYGYAEKAILWAVENNIAIGRDGTHFDPGGSVTYDEMLTFMARAAGVEVSGDDWQETARSWARQNIANIYVSDYEYNCPRGDVVYYLWKQFA